MATILSSLLARTNGDAHGRKKQPFSEESILCFACLIVLPLLFLPFVPEQTFAHYLSMGSVPLLSFHCSWWPFGSRSARFLIE